MSSMSCSLPWCSGGCRPQWELGFWWVLWAAHFHDVQVDVDHSGSLDFDEFYELLTSMMSSWEPAEDLGMQLFEPHSDKNLTNGSSIIHWWRHICAFSLAMHSFWSRHYWGWGGHRELAHHKYFSNICTQTTVITRITHEIEGHYSRVPTAVSLSTRSLYSSWYIVAVHNQPRHHSNHWDRYYRVTRDRENWNWGEWRW
jgi:hypothetical protein